MQKPSSFCLQPGAFRLPGEQADWSRWPVVACDQYTSQPD